MKFKPGDKVIFVPCDWSRIMQLANRRAEVLYGRAMNGFSPRYTVLGGDTRYYGVEEKLLDFDPVSHCSDPRREYEKRRKLTEILAVQGL